LQVARKRSLPQTGGDAPQKRGHGTKQSNPRQRYPRGGSHVKVKKGGRKGGPKPWQKTSLNLGQRAHGAQKAKTKGRRVQEREKTGKRSLARSRKKVGEREGTWQELGRQIGRKKRGRQEAGEVFRNSCIEKGGKRSKIPGKARSV